MGTGVAIGNVAAREDLVSKLCAGFEGKGFGEDEGVVAVKEEGGYLQTSVSVLGEDLE